MAGFQLIIYGRFWVFTEAPDAVKLADLVERYLKRLETYFKATTVRTHRTVSRNLLRFFRDPPWLAKLNELFSPWVADRPYA